MKIRRNPGLQRAALAVALAVSAGSAHAAWIWTGGTTPQIWTDPAAWDKNHAGDGEYPGHLDTVGLQDVFGGWTGVSTVNLTINSAIPNNLVNWSNVGVVSPSDVTITIPAGGSIGMQDVWLGRNGGTGTLDVSGGNFTVTAVQFQIANGDNSQGFVTVSNGGTVNVNASFHLSNNATNTAIISIYDGMFFANGMNVNTPGDDRHVSLNDMEAIFRLQGDQVAAMNAFVSNGAIRAGAGLDLGAPVYDATNNWTQIAVVPEPGSLVLLGLAGGMLILRRRA